MGKSPKAFRTISEVADWLETQAHVLRFWESKFSQVKPVKRAGGRRYYRPSDMLLLGGIKKLLHDDGMTIKGAQKLLREQGIKHVSDLSQPLDDEDDVASSVVPDAPMAQMEEQPPEEIGTILSFKQTAEKDDEADYVDQQDLDDMVGDLFAPSLQNDNLVENEEEPEIDAVDTDVITLDDAAMEIEMETVTPAPSEEDADDTLDEEELEAIDLIMAQTVNADLTEDEMQPVLEISEIPTPIEVVEPTTDPDTNDSTQFEIAEETLPTTHSDASRDTFLFQLGKTQKISFENREDAANLLRQIDDWRARIMQREIA